MGYNRASDAIQVDCILDQKKPAATLEEGLIDTMMLDSTIRSIEEKRPIPIDVRDLGV